MIFAVGPLNKQPHFLCLLFDYEQDSLYDCHEPAVRARRDELSDILYFEGVSVPPLQAVLHSKVKSQEKKKQNKNNTAFVHDQQEYVCIVSISGIKLPTNWRGQRDLNLFLNSIGQH